MSILGLDIGGANIKVSDDTGRTLSRPFAMWKRHEQLSDEIASILAEFPQTEHIAVTMTAELADCFATKSEGVRFILDAVEASAESRPVHVWTTAGRFASVGEAASQPMAVAAANWHALATWCGREVLGSIEVDFQTKAPLASTSSPQSRSVEIEPMLNSSRPALLIDIGTTTTDIIPIIGDRVAAKGLTDVGRLQTGELSYSGVKRTPVCAIAHAVPFRDGYCPLAAELFATTLDVYLLLGEITEDETDHETANGSPATIAAAHDRLARALCCDRDEVTRDEVTHIARFLADVQSQRLAGSLEKVLARFSTPFQSVIFSGSGSFLAKKIAVENRRLQSVESISLDDALSHGIAEAACAYAVARLLSATTESR